MREKMCCTFMPKKKREEVLKCELLTGFWIRALLNVPAVLVRSGAVSKCSAKQSISTKTLSI